MDRMDSFDADSPTELRDKLRANDVSVPPRGAGQPTEACEIWVTCRFLAALSETNLLDYPLHVEHGDRPDIVLSLPSGRTGVEITEAVPKTEADVDALSQREGIILDFRYVPPYRAGESRHSADQKRDIAAGRHPKLPHMGHSIECNWAEAMVYFTRVKARKFTRPGFTKHQRNWLVIYDDWSPAPWLDDHDLVKRLEGKLFGQDWKNPFDKVFFLRPPDVWEFSGRTDAVKHVIPDSWHASLNDT